MAKPTTVKVPLTSPVYANVDGIELTDNNYQLINGYTDELGCLVKRPALRYATTSVANGDTVPCMKVWPNYYTNPTDPDALFFVNKYRGSVMSSSGVVTALDVSDVVNNPRHRLSLGYVPGPTVAMLVCPWPTLRYYTVGAASIALSYGVALPARPGGITFLDGYSLMSTVDANSCSTPTFYWSNYQDATTWGATSMQDAMGEIDPVYGIYQYGRLLYLIGSRSIEIWEDDGVTPFSRVSGGYIPIGCAAQFAHALTPFGIFFIDHLRRFCTIDGMEVKHLSGPYDKRIAAILNHWSTFISAASVNGREIVIIHSGYNNGQTFVWDRKTGNWSEWTYKAESGVESAVPVACGDIGPMNNRSYLGLLGSSGNPIAGGGHWGGLHYLDQDLGFDRLDRTAATTQVIPFSVTSGHVNYGTTKQKRSEELRLILKRGNTGSGFTATLTLLDDNVRTSSYTIDLGGTNDTEIPVRLMRTGIFRTRQYTLTSSATVPIILASAEEDITVLRS